MEYLLILYGCSGQNGHYSELEWRCSLVGCEVSSTVYSSCNSRVSKQVALTVLVILRPNVGMRTRQAMNLVLFSPVTALKK